MSSENLTAIGVDGDGRIFALTDPPVQLARLLIDSEASEILLKAAADGR
ncbi:hypothetical protein ACOKGD_13940 [Microbacterium phosphatis]